MPESAIFPDTPLMRQHREIKESYPDAILFFRLGDFYEMFGEDAKVAAPILGLVLTSRQETPMCGVPFHSSSHHIAKLLKSGHKIAIAEQMEEPSAAKKLVRREVIRVITPGTVIEEDMLSPKEVNFLASVFSDIVGWGLAWLDLSTGEFWAAEALNEGGRALEDWLARIRPSEIVASQKTVETFNLRAISPAKTCLTLGDSFSDLRPDWAALPEWGNHPLARRAALQCLAYAARARVSLKEFPVPIFRETKTEMPLDDVAIRTLELVESSSGVVRHSLWGFLDRCATAMGSRLLKNWILHPLLDIQEIQKRQSCVAELSIRPEVRAALFAVLRRFSDLPRVLSRMQSAQASPRDFGGLRDSLLNLPEVIVALKGENALSLILQGLQKNSEDLKSTAELLTRALVDQPPARLSDGEIIRAGFFAELDDLRSLKSDGRSHLASLEASERTATGISTLKAGFNGVFGYYFEVTKAQVLKVPARYTRKQTLANAERYITGELKELENRILGAEEKISRLEKRLFEDLREEVLRHSQCIAHLSRLLAELDVFSALADNAALNNWVKPQVDLSYDLEIIEGRHPIVSSVLPAGSFIPNSLVLDSIDSQIMVLTGPNMSGKSTYLRQNALIVLMAQIGSFVPAEKARIGLVDKILTRIGASDALAEGASTFMVEMREAAHILKNATGRSLVILDEVGRGTATFDGISIAWAVLEYLNSHYDLRKSEGSRGPRVLFATHYFELTELEETLPGVFNANVSAREWTNPQGHTEVIFLHKVSQGPADRSYGIHVAALAGLPAQTLSRAREILARLEAHSNALTLASRAGSPRQINLDFSADYSVIETLKLLNPDKMTPMEALAALGELKKRVQ